jgi:zinc transport system substrate-binding protein
MIKKYIVILALFLSSSCGGKKPEKIEKPLVWVSIAPYQQLAQKIAGPAIEVQTIVPQGANPHAFEPTSRQVTDMRAGRVWFRIGEPFEKKLLTLLQTRNPDLTVLDLRDGVALIGEEGLHCSHCSMDHQDRHIWMSPKATQTQAREMAFTLQKIFPDQKEAIEKNLSRLLDELQLLDTQIHALLDSTKHRVFLVSHPAFGYFCRDYDCEQLSVEYEGKDPRPKHIEQIMNQAVIKKTEIAIALPQYNNKGAQLIAEKLHIPVRMIDPYSPHYFETMRSIAELIANPQEVKTP